MKKLLLAGMLTTILSGCVIHVGHSKEANLRLSESLNLDTQGLSKLVIDSGSGGLVLKGSETATNINVEADIRTDTEENVNLSLTRKGDTAYLKASFHSTMNWWKGNSPSIELDINLPESIELEIDDGSGSIDISNVKAPIDIEDGSGSIDIENVKGNIEIEDGSGSITVTNVIGNIEIEDGSGSIVVDQVTGTVEIDDSSGDLTVTNTDDMVVIEDGSGDIVVKKTKGLTILSSGSGDVDIIEINGKVSID